MTRSKKPQRGDRVRVERDEQRWPSRGTWPRYRGREGTVVTVNRTDREYGVAFGSVRERANGSLSGSDVVTWFRAHELTVLDPALDAT